MLNPSFVASFIEEVSFSTLLEFDGKNWRINYDFLLLRFLKKSDFFGIIQISY